MALTSRQKMINFFRIYHINDWLHINKKNCRDILMCRHKNYWPNLFPDRRATQITMLDSVEIWVWHGTSLGHGWREQSLDMGCNCEYTEWAVRKSQQGIRMETGWWSNNSPPWKKVACDRASGLAGSFEHGSEPSSFIKGGKISWLAE